MALVKMREKDTIERRLANGAAIIDEFQPHFNLGRVAHASREHVSLRSQQDIPTDVQTYTKITLPGGIVLNIKRAPGAVPMSLRQRAAVKTFVERFESDPQRDGRELVSETDDWSPAQFKDLGKKSPEASVRLLVAYRDELKRAA